MATNCSQVRVEGSLSPWCGPICSPLFGGQEVPLKHIHALGDIVKMARFSTALNRAALHSTAWHHIPQFSAERAAAHGTIQQQQQWLAPQCTAWNTVGFQHICQHARGKVWSWHLLWPKCPLAIQAALFTDSDIQYGT